MVTVTRAADVLRQAEASLREFVSKAAAEGDYPAVLQIAAWAQVVGDLAKKAPGTSASASAQATVAATHSTPKSAVPAKVSPAAKKITRSAKNEYPKFFRVGDQLLRIAWSKKEKKEYQHKAPSTVLQALAKAMAEAGKNGKVFTTDDVLPITDGDGGEIPAYQAYVGIALLKQTALIDQHGRQGYTIPRLGEFKDAVEGIWRKLPEQ